MGFLRRVLGGGGDRPAPEPASGGAPEPARPDRTDPVEDEIERDRRLLREEAERLDDALIQRQLRYADRAWVPSAQGGSRRADDGEGGAERE